MPVGTGGEKSDGRVTGSCEVYDPEADSWSKAGMLPQPRANPACASHRRELYCAGGYFGNTSHNNLWSVAGPTGLDIIYASTIHLASMTPFTICQ